MLSLPDNLRGACSLFAVRAGQKGIMSTGRGQGRACPDGRTRLSAPPPRLRYTMDMLFDPYADGPFQAASKAAAGTKSRSGSGLAGLDSGPDSAPHGGNAHGTSAHGGSPHGGSAHGDGPDGGWD